MPLAPLQNDSPVPRVLNAYLLGRLDFDSLLHLQRRLVYDVSGDRSNHALLLCEHPPSISIGRSGSSGDVLLEPEELSARRWPTRWVNRGGGTLLNLPGQIAIYPIFALDCLRINVQQYLDRLHDVVLSVPLSLEIPAALHPSESGVWVGDRRIAHVGVAIHDWVAYFGCALNVDPELKPFQSVRCDGHSRPMTSIQRESRVRVRPATVRQRLLAGFSTSFGFDRVSLFHHHPALAPRTPVHAIATRSG